jgi:hypothetical protein
MVGMPMALLIKPHGREDDNREAEPIEAILECLAQVRRVARGDHELGLDAAFLFPFSHAIRDLDPAF